jgi:hypothetical protein
MSITIILNVYAHYGDAPVALQRLLFSMDFLCKLPSRFNVAIML